MSTTTKTVFALIIIIAAGAALWWSGWLNTIGFPVQQPAQNTNATTTPEQQTPVNDLPTAADDTSDQALGRDVASLDVQVQAANNDTAQIDQGLNDTPIAQQANIVTATLTSAKTKASQEIDRRVTALQTLATRVSAMTKVTPELKANVNTVVQNQGQAFAQLKTDINAATSSVAVQAGVKTLTDSYRVYALILPQAYIIASSDRIVTVNNMLNGIGLKLRARLEAAQAAGANVTALATTLGELGAKIDSSNTHAQAAVNGTVSLMPDEGDKTKMDANTAALKAGRAEIVAAHKDIADARQHIATIVAALGTLQLNANATTTTGQ